MPTKKTAAKEEPATTKQTAAKAEPATTKKAAAKGEPKAAAAPGQPRQVTGDGTKEKPWQLQTPSLGGEFEMYRDPAVEPPALICRVGKTELRYHLRCIEDLHAMLMQRNDWVPLGPADEQKPTTDGTVEAWGRSPKNPVKGWYGIKKGLRGRFGMYLPPLLEALGLAELEHFPKNNRMRAIGKK